MSRLASFGIEVNFLTERYVATFHNDRRRGEWPPHPARVFSALVSVWAEDGRDPEERDALEWLEAQGAPAIAASEAAPRRVVSHFVPVNDVRIIDSNPSSSMRILPDHRTEPRDSRDKQDRNFLPQERFFPSVTPRRARATYLWEEAAPEGMGETMDHLLSRVARLGHSSSLVSCRVVRESLRPSYTPGQGTGSLRAVRRGQLGALQRQYLRHQGVRPRALPYTDVRYSSTAESVQDEPTLQPNTLGEWIVFAFAQNSRFLPATRAVDSAAAMRRAILKHAEDPIPEELSGHRPDGKPTCDPHVAFLPLPNIGSERGDARLLGIALSVPGSLGDDTRRALFRAVRRWEQGAPQQPYPLRLTLGSQGVLRMDRHRGPPDAADLRPSAWHRPSRRWVSATPIALPRHPGSLRAGSVGARAEAWRLAEGAVAAACVHVGLPEPSAVEIALSPFIAGSTPAGRYPPFSQRGREGTLVRRQLVHAAVTFKHPVEGPLMLGAGRFMGLGLMRPVPESR